MAACVVNTCPNNQVGQMHQIGLFPLPSDPHLMAMWTEAIGTGGGSNHNKQDGVYHDVMVCEEHFIATDYEEHVGQTQADQLWRPWSQGGKQLKSNAVPTRNLPRRGCIRHTSEVRENLEGPRNKREKTVEALMVFLKGGRNSPSTEKIHPHSDSSTSVHNGDTSISSHLARGTTVQEQQLKPESDQLFRGPSPVKVSMASRIGSYWHQHYPFGAMYPVVSHESALNLKKTSRDSNELNKGSTSNDSLTCPEPDKPYACEYCGRRFSLKTNMQVHIRIHTGERPFSCHTCGKRFIRKEAMNIHLRTHTREKPYACSLCGKTYGYRESLMAHMFIHCSGRAYSCNVCLKRYGHKKSLFRHKKVNHLMESSA